ncbi:MAG TPA: HD domain-containing phosphohydrolase [Myxococcota bacterium]|nr:HD domain-containing phosphohydrolase [Myxococcota bacterium]
MSTRVADQLEYHGPAGTSRVLIVDDEDVVRLVLEEALGNSFALALTKTAEEAVPFLTRQPPNIMLVDKNLPGMSGVDLLKQVKALDPEIEVIIITGYASLESAIEAMRLGAYDYLLKPFEDLAIVEEKVRLAGEKNELSVERRLLMEQVLASNKELHQAQQQLKKAYLQTLTSMITALEARDAYTRGHSDRVAEYSAQIGCEMGLRGDKLTDLKDAARLHDLGKIGIREDVLNKEGKLTDEEYKHIQSHPDIGADIVRHMEAYAHLIPLIRHHHERIDGKGYPAGLSGDNIPMQARIIAVADTYDAMTSSRPYRNPRSASSALRIIREVSGTQLDPTAVGAFLMAQAKMGDDATGSGST